MLPLRSSHSVYTAGYFGSLTSHHQLALELTDHLSRRGWQLILPFPYSALFLPCDHRITAAGVYRPHGTGVSWVRSRSPIIRYFLCGRCGCASCTCSSLRVGLLVFFPCPLLFIFSGHQRGCVLSNDIAGCTADTTLASTSIVSALLLDAYKLRVHRGGVVLVYMYACYFTILCSFCVASVYCFWYHYGLCCRCDISQYIYGECIITEGTWKGRLF